MRFASASSDGCLHARSCGGRGARSTRARAYSGSPTGGHRPRATHGYDACVHAPRHGDDWLGLTEHALPIDAAYEWAVRPDCGAVVLFSGTVRDHAEGREGVEYLTYEAYDEQVVPRMQSIVDEARFRWPTVGRLVLLHRTGRIELGASSVVVVASAPAPTGGVRSGEVRDRCPEGRGADLEARGVGRRCRVGHGIDRVAGGVDDRRAGGEERLSARCRRGRRGRVAGDRRGGDLPDGPLERHRRVVPSPDRCAVARSASRRVVDQVNRIDDSATQDTGCSGCSGRTGAHRMRGLPIRRT